MHATIYRLAIFASGKERKGLCKHGTRGHNPTRRKVQVLLLVGWGWLLHALRPVLDVVTFCGAFKQPVEPVRQPIQQVLLEENAAIHV